MLPPLLHVDDKSELHTGLIRFASRYSSNELCQRRIVERTLQTVTENPWHLSSECIWTDIFRVLHGVAKAELGLAETSSSVNFASRHRIASQQDVANRAPYQLRKTAETTTPPLVGRRLLVVGDDYLVASEMLTTLKGAGATVYGPVARLEQALEIIEGPNFSAAILDVDLQGDMVFPAASKLARREIPFVFVTGYDRSSMPEEFADAPYLTKPFDQATLVNILASITVRSGRRHGGQAMK